MNSSVLGHLSDTYKPFHLRTFWEDYYKLNIDYPTDWYFDLENFKLKDFDISTWDRNSEIIILGVGNTKLIDYLIVNKFAHVTLVDFSSYLINHLKKKYETLKECAEWDCNLIHNKSCM
jgi:hypothetical protein